MNPIFRVFLTSTIVFMLTTLAPVAPGSASDLSAERSGVEPLRQAHAHNDYEHKRPLRDALDHGFTSVEADVWLVNGELLVAHDLTQVKPGRTLESLYLEPLQRRVDGNGRSVFPGWRGDFQLLIDVKSEAETTYAAVDRALRDHAGMMTRFVRNKHVRRGSVTAIISGNRALATMQRQDIRYAGYDGRLVDLGSGLSPAVMPLVSDNWSRHFTWQGEGHMPRDERRELHRIVDEAHAAGHRARFWATPDQPGPAREALWAKLLEAGIDHINTDDLAGLQAFLEEAEDDRRAS